MLTTKKYKSIIVAFSVFGVILFGIPTIYANEGQSPLSESATDEAATQTENDLEEIALTRDAVIADLAERWAAESDASVETLSRSLSGATNEELLAIDEAGSFQDVLEVLGSTSQDFVYTPVNPCKIVDTRVGGGGFIAANSTRSYNVYGSLGSQGGSFCSSPRGEPRAVHIAVTVVNPNGKGNLKVFPYGASGSTGLQVNYAPIGTNLANAGTTKTTYLGLRDIAVRAQYAGCHVTIQVLGYYHDAEPEKITAVDGVHTTGGVTVSPSTYTTLQTKSVTIPYPGYVVLTGEASFSNAGSGYVFCRFTENGSTTNSWDWEPGDSDGLIDIRQTATYYKSVSSGPKTYRLECRNFGGGSVSAYYRNLIVHFVKETM